MTADGGHQEVRVRRFVQVGPARPGLDSRSHGIARTIHGQHDGGIRLSSCCRTSRPEQRERLKFKSTMAASGTTTAPSQKSQRRFAGFGVDQLVLISEYRVRSKSPAPKRLPSTSNKVFRATSSGLAVRVSVDNGTRMVSHFTVRWKQSGSWRMATCRSGSPLLAHLALVGHRPAPALLFAAPFKACKNLVKFHLHFAGD